MFTRLLWHLAVTASAGLLILTLFAAARTPAYADVFNGGGDVKNNLPSSYTVKIASFGHSGNSCRTWNARTLTCIHWWFAHQ